MAAQLGGEMSEIDEACRPLRELAAARDVKDDAGAQSAWVERWSALAAKVESFAVRDEREKHALTAGKKYLRACVYWLTAERMAGHGSPQKLSMYHSMLRCFERGVRLRNEPIEFVTILYEGTSLPALLYRAPKPGRNPLMIHFDGFDVTKEWMYLCGIAHEFAARGISTLMLDHPGVGAALRLQGMPVNYDSERWAKAAIDWLEGRHDVDPARIGVVAMSLGGYYAPRAAAFEKRLAACIAWGARWDNAGSHGRILRDPNAARSISGWVNHALAYYGARTTDEAYEKICRMTLDGVVERITCPLLVVHGANDRQVPIEQAERTVQEAVNSPRRELRVFDRDEGSAEHVGGDMFSPTIDYIADWAADVLRSKA
ncbi:MAG: alpha/beta hydrolase family protein [Pseudorhodoplanes sp.]|uniref:alpha/beta hydrolase family protein n=1 Tax=Pseudorhodoplanes sp. TaxID=1934341 RepID=UPI003D13DD7E